MSSIDDGPHLEAGEVRELEWKAGKKEYALMITMAIISLMVALDATILVSVLPTLAVDLGGSSTDAFWAGTSYLLACAVCQPFIAALSDIFGRKEMLMVSVLFFTMGTALCAPIAKNFTVFFIGRAVQGIGGGGIITMGQVIFADIVPLRQRPKYFSIVLAAWALGSVLGPLIGGLFVEHVFWAWCFYINFPFCVLGLVLVPIYVKLKTKKTSLMSKLARVDWIGSIFFTAGMTSFLVGISWAGIQYEWKSAQVIAPMAVGIFGVIATVIWEARYATEPILRPSLFYSTSAIFTYACALFQGLILFCVLYYVPFYFTAVHFVSPTQAGLDIFPVTCFLLPGSIVISVIVSRIGRFRWAIWAGWIISGVGCGLFELFDQDTPTPVWAVILAVFGVGQGMLLTSINVGIQAISRTEDAGRAAAMYAFMRTLGMSIGVAIGGTAFQNVMVGELRSLGLPESIAHNSEAFVKEMEAMDPSDPVRIGAMQAYVKGFHGVYWIVTASACAAFVASLFIKRHSMDKLLATKFVLRGGRAPASIVLDPPINQEPKREMSSSQATTLAPTPQLPKQALKPSSSRHAGAGRLESDNESTSKAVQEVTREKQDSNLSSFSNERAVVDVAAVAYYVEPDGKVTPVDILSTPAAHEHGHRHENQRQAQGAPHVELDGAQPQTTYPEILVSAPLEDTETEGVSEPEGVQSRDTESSPEPVSETSNELRRHSTTDSSDDHFEDSSPEPYEWTDPETLEGMATPGLAVTTDTAQEGSVPVPGAEVESESVPEKEKGSEPQQAPEPAPRPGSAVGDTSSYTYMSMLEPEGDRRVSRRSWS
ncbi:major facilitator superfamily domain-containing protein [Cercophora newfieldiana]|uniref:Major facilitator superfamily domain-containing protein n=1 Tax=Cercophora newfieldiana TaxID=92897 RepID=A0AA40CTL5_9PEZI|nr:major facilitator superfamily domain-containing protein [Cercophora newfieldiana]